MTDSEIQEELLTVDNLTLEDAEKKAVSKESAKFSQSEMTGEKIQRIRSTHKRLKDTGEDPVAKCGYCGKQKHNDRSKECKAFGETFEVWEIWTF